MEDNNAASAVVENAVAPSIPTFLLKLINMLNDESNHNYVAWNEAGTSFIVKDQVQFSKVVLPKYFKHNKFASFVRQLNMYGFRKITSLTQSGLNSEKEEIEFYHYLFIRGEEVLLEHIKRKVPKPEESTRRHNEDVTKVLAEVKQMKGHQENISTQLLELKQENEELWREVVSLRHKHSHQQKVVNKLIQFLVNLVHQHGIGVKRKLPLMIGDGTPDSADYVPSAKYSRPVVDDDEDDNDVEEVHLALEETAKPTVSFPTNETPQDDNVNLGSGPYITEVTTPMSITSAPGSVDISAAQQIHDPALVESTHDFHPKAPEIIPATPAFDVNEYMESTLNTPVNNVTHPTESVTFPNSHFNDIIHPTTYGTNQTTNYTVHTSTPSQQQYYQPPGTSNSPSDLDQYSAPPNTRVTSLSSHVNNVQNNLENIQDILFNNDQVQLDYGLIQELFSTSPDIMPTKGIDIPTSSGSENILGNELILHPSSLNVKNTHQEDLENDLNDLKNYM